MNISLNGAPHVVAHASTVRALLDELSLPPHALLIEHNGLALRRAEWDSTALREADRLEIIRIVAGG